MSPPDPNQTSALGVGADALPLIDLPALLADAKRPDQRKDEGSCQLLPHPANLSNTADPFLIGFARFKPVDFGLFQIADQSSAIAH